ncbi:heat shock protein GrpE [Bifidobacterium italicum]|uniref:Protein GrpE n=1 Tax=Bifidobacterium italicum TaxID=1960968 RepID=A0A2A2EL15_9BIFI|nr:nucleotide exchange factor GrpE [Bifidobacterium italicum]PAU69615.1 heat shock protein GrpE [Bifidobacterium italicum]
MSDFNKDDYLDDLPDADALANGQADPGSRLMDDIERDAAAEQQPEADMNAGAQEDAQSAPSPAEEAAEAAQQEPPQADSEDGKLTPLGQAKKEAAEYLEALQRERAEFINYRNRTRKDMDRARQQGIIDVLTAELPALDDIDRIREHGEMDESFKAVAAKIDKTFEKFGVEKFGVKGEDFDPTKHEAVLHKPDPDAEKATVDTVVEAGYRIGDRVIRAARVVVASPQN